MNNIILITILALLTGCASVSSVAYEQGELTKRSTPIVVVSPRISDKNISAYVKAKFIVEEDGRVGTVEIMESNPLGLIDKEIIRAIKKWRYRPAKLNGKTVNSWVETKINWNGKNMTIQ